MMMHIEINVFTNLISNLILNYLLKMVKVLCINTGLKNMSKAGKFETINTRFSNYLPRLIIEAINRLKSDILFNFYIDNNKLPNNKEFEILCKNIYILGPVYTNDETQIGFTGKNKMKIENDTAFVESKDRTVVRELFEESGLIMDDHLQINNGDVYDLSDFMPVKYNLDNPYTTAFMNQEEWFDVPRENKKYKFNSATIICCNKETFEECYSDSKIFFQTTRKLFSGDNINRIACINLIDVINFINTKNG